MAGLILCCTLGLVPVWVSTAFEAVARASPQTFVALEYEIARGASGCPDGAEFRANVARQLGYDPFRPAADRHVAVQIERGETGFEGRIRWSDARGNWVGDRRLSSQRADCSGIAASVAFSVAVEVQLMGTLELDGPKPLPPSPSAAPLSAVTPAASAASQGGAASARPESRSPEPASRLTLSAGVGPSLGLGLAPRATGVGRAFVTGGVGRFSLELAIDGALRVTQREPDGSGFSLDRFAGGAAFCGHAQAFAGCLTATFGRLEARGLGVDAPASPAGSFSQIGARLAATYNVGDRLFVSPRVEPVVMLSRWTVLLNENPVWTSPRLGALIGLDLGTRIF